MEREIKSQGGGQKIEKKNVRAEYHVGRYGGLLRRV
jgi:hypothetical protein